MVSLMSIFLSEGNNHFFKQPKIHFSEWFNWCNFALVANVVSLDNADSTMGHQPNVKFDSDTEKLRKLESQLTTNLDSNVSSMISFQSQISTERQLQLLLGKLISKGATRSHHTPIKSWTRRSNPFNGIKFVCQPFIKL